MEESSSPQDSLAVCYMAKKKTDWKKYTNTPAAREKARKKRRERKLRMDGVYKMVEEGSKMSEIDK